MDSHIDSTTTLVASKDNRIVLMQVGKSLYVCHLRYDKVTKADVNRLREKFDIRLLPPEGDE